MTTIPETATYRISLDHEWVLNPAANCPIVWKIATRDEAERGAADLRRRFPNKVARVYAVYYRGTVEVWDEVK